MASGRCRRAGLTFPNRAMRVTSKRIALLLVLAVGPSSAYAIDPALSLDQNVVRTWGVDDGLPQSTVFGLAQSSDGYMWAVTQEGLVRFDGVEFTVYDKAASAAIRNNMTTS